VIDFEPSRSPWGEASDKVERRVRAVAVAVVVVSLMMRDVGRGARRVVVSSGDGK
jgi:hypothetical protein